MFVCIDKKYFKGILLSAIAIMVLSVVLNSIGSMFTMGYYTDPAYFAVWSKAMMPSAGPPPLSFFLLALLFSFIPGLAYAGAYSIFMKSVPGKNAVEKGLFFGAVMFLVGGLPGMFSMYLLINLPLMLIVSWTAESAIGSLLYGVIIAKMVK